LKQSARPQFGGDIIRNGDAACAIDGSDAVFFNVWNDVAPQEPPEAWDHFRGSDAVCH
jgi:hypothetical protein